MTLSESLATGFDFRTHHAPDLLGGLLSANVALTLCNPSVPLERVDEAIAGRFGAPARALAGALRHRVLAPGQVRWLARFGDLSLLRDLGAFQVLPRDVLEGLDVASTPRREAILAEVLADPARHGIALEGDPLLDDLLVLVRPSARVVVLTRTRPGRFVDETDWLRAAFAHDGPTRYTLAEVLYRRPDLAAVINGTLSDELDRADREYRSRLAIVLSLVATIERTGRFNVTDDPPAAEWEHRFVEVCSGEHVALTAAWYAYLDRAYCRRRACAAAVASAPALRPAYDEVPPAALDHLAARWDETPERWTLLLTIADEWVGTFGDLVATCEALIPGKPST